ncbi:lycopene cyclase family protein [uncultured Muriicola sp.]|uniref:lycopene cyclase family protein n=1 Tax=uncultured Muriicola sp. TaxID=1583102 RepID=UPI0026056C15|nr:lycopene cyclase family protein [uncultured Muriicola sp.]
MKEYDFIIIGAGAAGLMMADGMGKDPAFRDKSILLLDKDDKTTNDRTWCFWEKGPGAFDNIVHKKWDEIYFAGKENKKIYPITPYSYKMVRGIDFYQHYLKRISSYPNVTFRQEAVKSILDQQDMGVNVGTDKNNYLAKQVFDSQLSFKKFKDHPRYPILQQHFIGWFIQTKEPVFDPRQATFMDFSVAQKGNTRFMYVLPFSETSALLEYTLFSGSLLPKEEYETAIVAYMDTHFKGVEFEIVEKEQGSIPMTCIDFTLQNSRNVYHIGTAGGWSKPSTGYTFRNTALKSEALIQHLKANKPLDTFQKRNRFWMYDVLLLNILYRNNALGRSIFESLFTKRKPQLIFKFLDEETRWYEDAYIMMSPKPIPFVKSLIRHVYWIFTGTKKRW